MTFDPEVLLKQTGRRDDSSIDLAHGALALAAMAHQGISVDRYIHHIEKLSKDVRERLQALLDGGAKDDASTRLAALKHVLADGQGYEGDVETYDDLQNADLIRVIERRKGMPIALAILYIQVGRNNGFQIDGINFPGHFLCRIEYKGQRLIFDPFLRCNVMEAPELRQLIKRIKGMNAELSADYYEEANNREILIRLQNNIKTRLIEAADYKAALQSVEWMRLIAPDEYRLLFDAGVLYAKTGAKEKAIEVLEQYILVVPSPHDRRDAEDILYQLKDTP